MHNLHLVRIKAESHNDACTAVLSYIEDWGNENNWRSIGGAICEDGTGKRFDDYTRWPVDVDDVKGQIEHLNKSCLDAVKGTDYTSGVFADMLKEVMNMTVEEILDAEVWGTFYTAGQFFRFVVNTAEARHNHKDEYDIFTSIGFCEYSYDDFGLTDLGNNGYNEDELKNVKTYVVLVDMHS
mgnify:CR=1 FL=1